MKVWVVEKIDEWDGQVDTKVEIFDSKEKAIKCMQDWKDNDHHFICDVQSVMSSGNKDSYIIDEETYFYCYDALNFDALTITITEKEIL